MTDDGVIQVIKAMACLDKESLNGDPMSFKGKIVVPLNEDKILKIMSSFDAAGERQILNLAASQGLDFFLKSEVVYSGILTFMVQIKLNTIKMPDIYYDNKVTTLNEWCGASLPEELIISKLVEKDYGKEGWQKIRDFTKRYNLGNIYWRNIGFDKEGKIHCFDFQCGLARNEKGEFYV